MTLPSKMHFGRKSLSMGKNVFLKCTAPRGEFKAELTASLDTAGVEQFIAMRYPRS